MKFEILGKLEGDSCGAAVAISADGSTIAIGSPGTKHFEQSRRGEVSVYTISTTGLIQKGAILQGKNNHLKFGTSLALSADGNTLIVGIPNSHNNTGEINIYEWQDKSWNLKGNAIYGRENYEQAGLKTCISADGNTIAFLGQHFIEIYFWSNRQWVLLSSSYYNNPSGVALSPNGKQMAFCSIEHGQNYIRIIELHHSNWQQKGSAIAQDQNSLRFYNTNQRLLINTNSGLIDYHYSDNSWKHSVIKTSVPDYKCLKASISSADCKVFANGIPNAKIILGKDTVNNLGRVQVFIQR